MREFTVGGVLRRVAALVRARPWVLLGLAALFMVLPHALSLAALSFATARTPVLAAVPVAVYWLGSLLLEAGVVRLAVDAAAGQPSRFADLLGTAARAFLPILAITLLSGVAFMLAGILLLFPAAMLMCRWYVSVPVAVAEESGILMALGRSAHLTDGVRWRVFGLILVQAVLNLAVSFGIGFVGGFAARTTQVVWPSLAGTVGGTAASMLIAGLFYAAVYVELREIREGVMSDELVSVFN